MTLARCDQRKCQTNMPLLLSLVLAAPVLEPSVLAAEAVDAPSELVLKLSGGRLKDCPAVAAYGHCSNSLATTHCPMSCASHEARVDAHTVTAQKAPDMGFLACCSIKPGEDVAHLEGIALNPGKWFGPCLNPNECKQGKDSHACVTGDHPIFCNENEFCQIEPSRECVSADWACNPGEPGDTAEDCG